MFSFFVSLYYSMFVGQWRSISLITIRSIMVPVTKEIGTFLTSIFGDVQMTDLGQEMFGTVLVEGVSYTGWIAFVCFVLALITSIGIVVVATKGIKKLFTVFFYGVR